MKPGHHTTEFWMTLAASVLPALTPALPATWQVAIPAIATAAYTISRGVAKHGASRAAKPKTAAPAA